MKQLLKTKDAIRIKCCYCELKEECTRRIHKEREERHGLTTYCTLTTNRPQSRKKKRSKKRLSTPIQP